MSDKQEFTGCKVRYGFLAGNLGEMESHADSYGAEMKKQLENQFPGAEIEVIQQDGEGQLPWNLSPEFTAVDGELNMELTEDIRSLGEEVFSLDSWY